MTGVTASPPKEGTNRCLDAEAGRVEVKTLGSTVTRCAARGRRVAPFSLPVSPTERTSLTGRLRALSEPILAERFEQRLALGAP